MKITATAKLMPSQVRLIALCPETYSLPVLQNACGEAILRGMMQVADDLALAVRRAKRDAS